MWDCVEGIDEGGVEGDRGWIWSGYGESRSEIDLDRPAVQDVLLAHFYLFAFASN